MHAIQSAEAMSLKEKKTQPLVPHQDQRWMIWKWRKRSLSFAKYPPNSLLSLDFPPASSPAFPWGTSSSRSAPSQPGFQLDSAHPAGPLHLPRPTAAFWLTTFQAAIHWLSLSSNLPQMFKLEDSKRFHLSGWRLSNSWSQKQELFGMFLKGIP